MTHKITIEPTKVGHRGQYYWVWYEGAMPKQSKASERDRDERPATLYKKVLHTPPKHVPDKRTKGNKEK